jgi:hypothetical protein
VGHYTRNVPFLQGKKLCATYGPASGRCGAAFIVGTAMPQAAWKDKLARRVKDTAGNTLRTYSDVLSFMLALPDREAEGSPWQAALDYCSKARTRNG